MGVQMWYVGIAGGAAGMFLCWVAGLPAGIGALLSTVPAVSSMLYLDRRAKAKLRRPRQKHN